MADEFAERLLRSSLALMCLKQGWNQASNNGLQVFSNVIRHYFENIGVLTLKYSLYSGRYEPVLDDLAKAFQELGISLSDLKQFWQETESNCGAKQLPRFPAQVSDILKIPEESTDNPDYIPDYLPSVVTETKPPPVEDITIKEETTVLNETNPNVDPADKSASDAFDEAVAVAIGPSFPFFNKTEVSEPKVSSWGFQRVTIDSSIPTISNNANHRSPELINENSDDFVFASRLTKSKEDNKNKAAAVKPELNGGNENIPENMNTKTNHTSDDDRPPEKEKISFKLSFTTSTPLPSKSKVKAVSSTTHVTKDKPAANSSPKTTIIKEEISGFAPESIGPIVRSLSPLLKDKEIPLLTNGLASSSLPPPDQHSPDFSDLKFDDSNVSLLNSSGIMSPASPVTDLIKPEKYVPSSPQSPPNKRKKLNKPVTPPELNSLLLKDRPDLIIDKVATETTPKINCKLVNNHQKVTPIKIKKPPKVESLKVTLKNHSVEKAKKRKPLDTNKPKDENHKVKRKKRPRKKSIELFAESPIKLPKTSVVTPPKKASLHQDSSHSTATPKISPISLSLSKPPKSASSDSVGKYEIIPKKPASEKRQNSVPPLKLTVKAPSNSKIKSKCYIDSEDDSGSLSSNSLDGFESLIPIKPSKEPPAKPTEAKKLFKTKAELKNPCIGSNSMSEVVPTEKKKQKPISTKIKIAKNPSPVLSSMKLKLPIPAKSELHVTPNTSVNISAATEPSLFIDESIVLNQSFCSKTTIKSESQSTPLQPSTKSQKVPKIKIKIASNNLSDVGSPPDGATGNSDTPKYTSSAFTSPEKPIKPLKLKLSEPKNAISPISIPKPTKDAISKPIPKPKTVKKKTVKEKPPKVKKEPKESKDPKPLKSIKIKPILKDPKDKSPVIPPSASFESSTDEQSALGEGLESTVFSETVETVTVASTVESVSGGADPALPDKIWYCPSCMLPDDGSPMVGCDMCDEWYHCMNFQIPQLSYDRIKDIIAGDMMLRDVPGSLGSVLGSNPTTLPTDPTCRDTLSIQVRVPTSEHVAEIVGKQGCKIKLLRVKTRTYIQTPAREQEPVFTISGYPEDVEKARLEIEEAADHFTKIRQGREDTGPITPQLGPNAVVRYVRVPLKYVGLVVGPKGHNIKRIQSETDTFIMTPARDKDPIFEIRGNEERVKEAENKLLMYIAMRTGGMFDDPDNSIDIDLKKPMLPPKQKDAYFGIPGSQGLTHNKTWYKPEAYGAPSTSSSSSPSASALSNLFSPTGFGYDTTHQQSLKTRFDAMARSSMDSGYNSPSTDPTDLIAKLLEQVSMSCHPNQYHQDARSTTWSSALGSY